MDSSPLSHSAKPVLRQWLHKTCLYKLWKTKTSLGRIIERKNNNGEKIKTLRHNFRDKRKLKNGICEITAFFKLMYLFSLEANYFIIFWWFLHTLTWISHVSTCVPHPLGCPSAPALSVLFHASNLDWRSISHMVTYMFQCYSLKSSHPRFLPQSPNVCSLYLCLFFCLTYSIIITIFLYMC